jgi:hypothetical protein
MIMLGNLICNAICRNQKGQIYFQFKIMKKISAFLQFLLLDLLQFPFIDLFVLVFLVILKNLVENRFFVLGLSLLHYELLSFLTNGTYIID